MINKTWLKLILTILLALNFVVITIDAATTGTLELVTSTAVDNRVELAQVNANGFTQLENGYTKQTFGTVTLHSNDADGFTVSISSANSGKLKPHDANNAVIAGATELNYDVHVAHATNADNLGVGSAATQVDNANSFTLSTAEVLTFSGPATKVTDAYVLNLQFTTAASAALLGGNYKDTITVTIGEI